MTFILFGGTGDLVKRKLVPAFSQLVHNNVIGKNSAIIGISRKPLTDSQYKEFLSNSLNGEEKNHIKNLNIQYFKGDFENSGLYGLKELIEKSEMEASDRIFYLSTSFRFFPGIVKELKLQGLHKKTNRIVFEKPFGNDLKSSELLDSEIHSVFNEKEVYRIDHYLAKGTVQNLNVLKFTNPILYSGFGNRSIEEISLTIDESLGVESRLEFYNEAGAIKDMIQSHLLQVLSLILMERPESFEPDKIHDAKVKVLKNLKVSSSKENLIGQYDSYSKELKSLGLQNKNTETFAKIILDCKMERWKGVKLILRTGKKLEKKFGFIKIKFKTPHEKFLKGFSGAKDNEIIIGIYPAQDVTIWMNTRTPEQNNEVKPVKFEFCQECEFGPNTTYEYAVLLEEIIKGDKTLFTRSDEVKESWKIAEQIEKMRNKIRFVKYRDGSNPEKITSKFL